MEDIGRMTLDWSRFEKGTLGPERAFEAFSERSLPHHELLFSHHYLAMDLRTMLDACRDIGLVPMWCVRVWREATPALWMEGHRKAQPSGLIHRSRDASWLLFWDEQRRDLDVVPQTDVLKPWAGEAR